MKDTQKGWGMLSRLQYSDVFYILVILAYFCGK